MENKMDIGILNNLGYIEVIEISIWLGVMYYGKCWIDNKFKQEIIMRKFPIDSRNEIGKKRVKVPSMMIDKMEESMLREKIKEIIKKIK